MRIGYLGAGCWGFCLASVLASKGHEILIWTNKQDLADRLNAGQDHPNLPGCKPIGSMRFSTKLEDSLKGVDLVAESVTSAGVRPVFEAVKKSGMPNCPIVLTSKGIEQNTGLILPEVAVQVFGNQARDLIGFLSGPGFAKEVIHGLPTLVVGTAYNKEVMSLICETFTTQTFRVYPNADLKGVAYGGALKNIIAIACGISDGLRLGSSSKAALMTRGLHEIRKLAVASGCKAETLNGLSGMGDICLTCNSIESRNYRLGFYIAEGKSVKEALKSISTVVEGVYTCVSAMQLSKQLQSPMPITDMVYRILFENMQPSHAVQLLMQRTIKEEHL